MRVLGERQQNEGRRDIGEDDAAAISDLLAGAPCARSDPATAERAVTMALALAPDDVEARLAAYRFYFYNHRLAEALPHAAAIVVQSARRLNVATDWRLVRPEDAAFSDLDDAPSLYLQALLAWGYCSARLGRTEDGCRALEKVVELDPRDRFGARRLLAVIAAGDEPEAN
ncbi:MAG: hypothetical protein HXX10_13485 [Rhodoplanes sp.]|uniref:hypothetical protein n=1 Tax=Rhodoplanes sp. TaxID=1968906 RepID=UPI00183BBB17|nr:hypothetical protein [Rhodoplanes sp.]NVO15041.1 hypothetical protein [Rhodoplanes sp.]